MNSDLHRDELISRLKFTFMNSRFEEIDELILGLRKKPNFPELCEEFFAKCRINNNGTIAAEGFFANSGGNSPLYYAMYEILGATPNDFLLKHRVTSVRLIRNSLKGRFRLPRSIFSLPRLKNLTIRGIGISRLPQDIKKAKDLEILDLSSNLFTRLPASIPLISNLKVLNMSFNRIHSLPAEISRLANLRNLNLRGNVIGRLPVEFYQLQNLCYLDLSMNAIKGLSQSIITLRSLQQLRVRYNEMSAEEEATWENRTLTRENSVNIRG